MSAATTLTSKPEQHADALEAERALEALWAELRKRASSSRPLPNLADLIGATYCSEAEVEELMRRFEAGEFRNE